jgi:sentrin-specific protease 1
VINFYLNLLKERETRQPSLPRCHFFNTFFYAKLLGPRGYDYAGVRRWTMRGPVDVFALDKVIVPIHLKVHWCLAVINVKEKRFEYYDSLGGNNQECLRSLRRYMIDEYADKKKGTLSLEDWTDYVPSNIPMQKNGAWILFLIIS